MNILKKNLAPVTDQAWKEIKEVSGQHFNSYLTGRKVVDIDGPNGMDFGAVSTGRLITPEDQDHEGVNYGIREVMPLIEVRKPFELDVWELDNIDRGTRDANLDSMEKAAREIAEFENNAIFYGFTPASIKGFDGASNQKNIKLPDKPEDIVKVIATQVVNLKKSSVEGPYSLVINSDLWQRFANISPGYPVMKQLKQTLGGEIIINHTIKDSFLVSRRGGDYELALGQDISIGYDGHDNKKVKLFFTESFTFRILSPEAVIVIKS